MQENTRNISARVGAVSAVALLAVSGAFIAGPAMAVEVTPTAEPTETTTPSPAPTGTATPTPTPSVPTTPTPDPTGTATPTPTDTATPAPTGTATPTPTGTATPTPPSVVLEAPTFTDLVDGDVIKTNQIISGTAPGATSVELTANGEVQSVPVAEDGSWKIGAPTFVPEGGTLSISAVAVNGENRSEPATLELTVEDAALPAPSIATTGRIVESLASISGNGVPGTTVTVTVASSEGEPVVLTAEAGDTGVWEAALPAPLGYGSYELSAVQALEGKQTSPAGTSSVRVVPAAPVVTSPGNGSEIPVNKLPAMITGTAVPGAEVELVVDFDIDGEYTEESEIPVQETFADASGNWAIPLNPLTEGAHNIVAIQAVGEHVSDFSETNFTVTAAVVEPPVTVNPVPVGNPGAGGGLPDTGAANLGLLAGGGAALLTAGGAALLFNRRRNAASES